MTDSFTLKRPNKRPEFWTREEWSAAVLAADWKKHANRVARDYDAAKREILQAEFDAAWKQRATEAMLAHAASEMEAVAA